MSYVGEVLADAPALYYRLGESSGTNAADSSGNGRDGTISGAPLMGQTGALATDADLALYFDGSNDKITLPALPAIGTTFTIECWLKHDSGADTRQAIFVKDDGTQGLFFGSDFKLNLRYSGADHKSNTALSVGIWHHVVVVVTAGAGVFYIDGVADGTAAAVLTFTPERIGDDTGSDSFKGWLDELALFASALSSARVLAHLGAGFRGLLNLRTRLRRELHDEDSTNYRWPDNALDRHLLRAIDAISEVAPDEKVAALTATAGSRDLSISTLSDVVAIERVEWPISQYPREYVLFSTWGTTLTLETENTPSASSLAVNVYYGKRHAVERLSSTLLSEHDDVCLLGASAFALLELADYTVNRVNTGGTPAVSDYRLQGSDRLSRFRDELHRFGRASRLRASVLYAPALAGPASQTSNPGPGA